MAKRTPPNERRPPASPTPVADPLADMVRAAGLGEAVRTALQQVLAHQLVEDHFAKLDQAGHPEDEGIPLRRVFIDLYTDGPGAMRAEVKKGFVGELLEKAPLPLGAEPIREEGLFERFQRGVAMAGACSGFVLVGGPGQGKSTLGQLACQAHRAALLVAYQPMLTTHERAVLADFTDPEAVKELGIPLHPSLPVRIVLPEAAVWMAAQERLPDTTAQERSSDVAQPPKPNAAKDPERPSALLRFWCSQLSAAVQQVVGPAELLAVLRTGPFLLVLDGLDEVPAAAARARVLSAVRELGAALRGAPGWVVGTTRPQGYSGELDGLGLALETRWLSELTPERALEYAGRLLKARLPHDGDRAKALGRMREASAEATTRRLMTTPLQVTILAALLKKGGRPPRERWSLFDRYYDVMYAREEAKPTETAELLSTYKTHIRNIHARAGLLLQVESENAERTTALLTRERMAEIIEAVLSEEGFPATHRPALIEQMIAAAAHRLVFLVQPQEGLFGFEIRSLQEFMAAVALAQKSEADTKRRLIHIAKAGSFRNVTLFLAGKLLSEPGDLRDAVAGEVCPALEQDPGDVLARAAKASAVLALEILEDGAALNQPKRAEDLTRIALGILDLGPSPFLLRLVHLLVGEETPAKATLEPMVRDALQARLAGAPTASSLGAWLVLLRLMQAETPRFDWAEILGERAWPEDAGAQQAIVEAALTSADQEPIVHPPLLGRWLIERVAISLVNYRPSTLARLPSWLLGSRPAQDRETRNQGLLGYFRWSRFERILVKSGGERTGWVFVISVKAREDLQQLLHDLPAGPAWQAFRTAAPFEARPDADTLADVLRNIAELSLTPKDREWLARRAPWPLRMALALARSPEELFELSDRARAGFFGNAASWRQAEERWIRDGVDLEGVLASTTMDTTCWSQETLLVAPSSLGLSWSFFQGLQAGDEAHAARVLWGRVAHTPSTAGDLAVDLGSCFAGSVLEPLLSAASLEVLGALVPRMTTCRTDVLASLLATSHGVSSLLDQWGRMRPEIRNYHARTYMAATIADMYVQNPALHGLLHFVASLLHAFLPAPLLPDLLLRRERFEDPRVRGDAWLLRVWNGAVELEELPLLLQDGQAAALEEAGWLSRLAWTATIGAVRPVVREALLTSIYKSTSDVGGGSYVLQLMHDVLQARWSGLQDPDIWTHLELPLPQPAMQTSPQPPGPDLSGPPVVLEKLVLSNIRSLEHIALDLSAPRPDEGQWIVLLGENGTGKSTVLRAIVLALRNLADPQIWPERTYTPAWRRLGMNVATDTCRVTLHLGNGSDYETTVHQNGKEIFKQSPERSAAAPAPCLLWAYGCRRGSALAGKDREVDLSEVGGPDIATLFDEGASLIHAQTWLQKLDGEASRDKTGQSAQIRDAVFAALKTILEVDHIELDNDSNVLVTGALVGNRVPLAALSDGYLTTAGWLLDLLARWVARAKQAKLAIDKDFPEKMVGLVLLDEIDLHLHPAWQLCVIPRVRKLFKRLSFVVTTHNPLTLVGARPEEIWILQRHADGVHAERRPDIPATLTTGQLYGSFFGVDGFFPDPLGRNLQRYGFLCGNPYRTDEEQTEMETLRAELEKAGVAPGWEEQPRATETAPPRQRLDARAETSAGRREGPSTKRRKVMTTGHRETLAVPGKTPSSKASVVVPSSTAAAATPQKSKSLRSKLS